jgi:methyl-accepting chemotaxis protein
MGNFKIGTKLIGGFMIVILLLAAVAAVGYLNMKSMAANTQNMYNNATVPVRQIGAAQADICTIRGELLRYELSENTRAATKQSIEAIKADIKTQMDAYRASSLTEAEKAGLAEFDAAWAAYQTEFEKSLAYVDSGNVNEFLRSIGQGGSTALARDAAVAAIVSLVNINVTIAEQYMDESNQASAGASLIIIALAAIGVILALVIAIVITRSITGPIGKIKAALKKLAVGDITETITIKSRDEVGQMAASYSDMQKYLSEMCYIADKMAGGDLTVPVQPKSQQDALAHSVSTMISQLKDLVKKVDENAGQISAASEQLASASEQSGSATDQIASVSQQIAKGSQEQTKGIGEVNDAMVKLTSAIEKVNSGSAQQAKVVEQATGIVQQVSSAADHTATSAQEAASSASHAAEIASQSSATTEKAIQGIRKINLSMQDVARRVSELGKHSEEIGSMISVIDDIAAQTNLLALNAAIEAARAGDQGRGFAVVADEVKKLAERTAKETKDISTLVSTVQKGVSDSIQASMEGAKLAEEGTDLANQAGTALGQILNAMKTMTSQIEQISAAAEEMSASASEMVKVIDAVSKTAGDNLAATRQMAGDKSKATDATHTVSSTIEENSAATEQMSASAQEMSAQVQQVVASSRTLASMAEILKKSVSIFKIQNQSLTGEVAPDSTPESEKAASQ